MPVRPRPPDEEEEGAPSKVLRQTPRQLYDELAVLISRERNERVKADLVLQQARTWVRIHQDLVEKAKEAVEKADLEKDPLRQREARLALFKAEEYSLKKVELEAKKVEAEAEASQASSAAKKELWDLQFVDAMTELRTLEKNWPLRFAERKEQLEKEHRVLPAPAVLTELDDLEALGVILDDVCAKTPLDIDEHLLLDVEKRRREAARYLGDFYNPSHDWVVTKVSTEWTIDMILQPSLIGSRRPLATVLQKEMEFGQHHLVIGLSGGGKTSGVVDLAADHFIIYFQCNDETPGRHRYLYWFDRGFAKLVYQFRKELGSVLTTSQALFAALPDELKERERYNLAYDIARRLALVEFLARLCQLWQFVRERPEATTAEFFAFQRGRGHDWIEKVQVRLSKLSESSCRSLITQLCRKLFTKSKLLVVFDEIQEGFAIESGRFFDGAKHDRGILFPIINALSSLPAHFIYMGTGASFDGEPTLVSAIGKESSLKYVYRFDSTESIEMFPTVSADVCQRFFRMLNVADVLDVDRIIAVPLKRPRADLMAMLRKVEDREGVVVDESFALQVINHLVVGSRFRTLALIVPGLQTAAADLPEASKRDRLNYALSVAVLAMTTGLVDNFRKLASAEAPDLNTLAYNELLLNVWTATMLSEGRIRFYGKDTRADLIRLGLAFGYGKLRPTDDGLTEAPGWYRVTEPIAVVALQEYFEGSRALRNQFAHLVKGMATLLEKHGLNASRGTLFEDMVFAAFQQERFQGRLVADLPFVKVPLEEMHANSATLRRSSRLAAPVAAADPWWTKTTFRVTSVVREDAQREQLGLNVADFLSTHPRVLVSPETTARFDGMVMLGPKEALTLAITMWAGRVPSDKVQSQIRSTDPAQAYYLASGEKVNPDCSEQRWLWEARGLNQVRAVRVHVALPESSPRPYATIEGDSLLVHLDMRNIHLLFGNELPELYDILAVATRTKREDWGAPVQ